MNNAILILGDSGTGKSTSIRNLPPEQTFILNTINKPLPFRGSSKKYTRLSPDGMSGNIYDTFDFSVVKKVIKTINEKRTEIKYLILDDAGYLIMKDFIKNALVKGYDKYVMLAKEFSEIIDIIKSCRDDLFCFISMHIENQADGKTKPKTIGNMIDKSVNIEGHFTYILHTAVVDKSYKFITNNDGLHMAKTPMGMFDHYIENDLLYVVNKIVEYENEDLNLGEY